MQIKIGSSLFIGGSSRYHLSPSLQGLESPAIRTGDGVYAGRDGGYVSGHFYGQRTIVIPGFYIGSDCDDASELRKVLLGYMRIRYSLPIVITDFGGNTYYTEGFVKDVKATIDSPVAGQFQITLLCPDPLMYDLFNGGITESDTWKTIEVRNTVEVTVNNAGNVDTYPVFRCSTALNTPTLENLTTQQSFTLNTTISGSNTELVIDMKRRTVTLNGDSISQYRTTNSSWWSLIPGSNIIKLTDGQSTSTARKGTLYYQYGRAGI